MTALSVRSINPAVGAEIEGLEPRLPLDDDTMDQLRAAFDDRGLLVFRDLDIDEEFQRYLVFSLIHEPIPAATEKTTISVSNKLKGGAAPYGRLLFHCDNMWARTPQPAISFFAQSVEQPSAPTLFVGMGHAWNTLSDDLRARVESREARHGFDRTYPNRGGDNDVIDAVFDRPRFSVRPVAFRHPRTGRRLLYVSQQATIEILGLSRDDNEALLDELFTHLYDPAIVYGHQWRNGDLVIWDNIAVQHGRGMVRLDGPERTLRKVTGPMNIDPDEYFEPLYSGVTTFSNTSR
jgi:alpha-ketoglutarate-dependent taurine dioxygenase